MSCDAHGIYRINYVFYLIRIYNVFWKVIVNFMIGEKSCFRPFSINILSLAFCWDDPNVNFQNRFSELVLDFLVAGNLAFPPFAEVRFVVLFL